MNNTKNKKEIINIFCIGIIIGALLLGTLFLLWAGIYLAILNKYITSIIELIKGVILMFFLRYVSKLFRNKYIIKYE